MPAGTLYVSAPSKQLSAQFHTPCDFLHFHVSPDYFPSQQLATRLPGTEGLNDLIVLRDPFAEQLAKALTEHGDTTDEEFAQCIGQTLAMHLARLEFPRTKVNALPKWRLRRVEEYVNAHFERCISLSDLAKVAGLSRMHFAAQFRAATGYRPREYLLHQRIAHAKSLLSRTETPLAEVALTVGFCTQAHFSTVFKRITGETPARWRCASKERPAFGRRHSATSGHRPAPAGTVQPRRGRVKHAKLETSWVLEIRRPSDLRCCGCKRLRPRLEPPPPGHPSLLGPSPPPRRTAPFSRGSVIDGNPAFKSRRAGISCVRVSGRHDSPATRGRPEGS